MPYIKRKKRTPHKAIEDRLDNLASQLCKLRAGGRCYMCSRTGTDSHHIVGRDHRRVRWDQNNLVCLCRDHHDEAGKKHWTFGRDIDIRVKIWHLSELQEMEKEIKKQIKELS